MLLYSIYVKSCQSHLGPEDRWLYLGAGGRYEEVTSTSIFW